MAAEASSDLQTNELHFSHLPVKLPSLHSPLVTMTCDPRCCQADNFLLLCLLLPGLSTEVGHQSAGAATPFLHLSTPQLSTCGLFPSKW